MPAPEAVPCCVSADDDWLQAGATEHRTIGDDNDENHDWKSHVKRLLPSFKSTTTGMHERSYTSPGMRYNKFAAECNPLWTSTLNRMMVPNDHGPDPTLPRCRREYSLRDCRPPDPIRSSTHRLGFADFLGPDQPAVGDPACTNKQLVQRNPLCVLDSEARSWGSSAVKLFASRSSRRIFCRRTDSWSVPISTETWMPAFQLRFFTLNTQASTSGCPCDWLRPEEQRDSIRWDISS